MPSLRTITLVVASALCVTGRSLGTAASTSTSSACSNVELQQVQTQIAAIRATLESDAGSSSKASSVPSTCVVALTFDLSAASKDDEETCANDCLAWIEDVVEAPTCGDEEMFMYKRRMTAYLKQCREHRHVRFQENNHFEHSNRLRGLAAGHAEGRGLGVKGLMDALLVVTLNNAL
ncbi:hypothetical protein F442_18331 [Phytophthora nicotianae P10297]|uniref:Pectinesterase inhibitor domain-containing protein n=3 Tax=Phytophthora nicotianae TaxID=4792 RepID=W2PLE0_PHYN3|nr:hypothetical protein PPTG_17336 [Phytophthora nicotianae INRA-310]ETL28781.1 hypothetical protein L916_17923 [Phytophthora nicotianae]ETN01436.1 hypothetical protein PPTG_17336 [Phytophthora nicotianae INRA-310]ETP33060.1 hypothetical protein F442_18331 [Phytophthora nicotianae P10297]KUF78557.1 hypothetical protein AM587_10012404 [Phytophthora nicotianae]